MFKLPELRTADLIEQAADKELLIYDLRSDKAYYLNETLTNVYYACGERLSFDSLKQRHRYSDELIYLALDELRKSDLLIGEISNHFADLSRREVIKRVSLSSLAALPVIAAVTAPTAVNASSLCTNPGGTNIEPGCPVGTSITGFSNDCSPAGDPGRNSFCRVYNNQCQSGNAVYRTGSCTVSGNGSSYGCSCA